MKTLVRRLRKMNELLEVHEPGRPRVSRHAPRMPAVPRSPRKRPPCLGRCCGDFPMRSDKDGLLGSALSMSARRADRRRATSIVARSNHRLRAYLLDRRQATVGGRQAVAQSFLAGPGLPASASICWTRPIRGRRATGSRIHGRALGRQFERCAVRAAQLTQKWR